MQTQPQKPEKTGENLVQKPSVHLFLGRKRRFTALRRGFSLIEILVVVSIIGLILGIGTAAALKMTAEARKEQTRAMMEGLLSANDEYKAVRQGSSISHTGPTAGLSSTEQFVQACLQIKTCEEIMMAALSSSSKAALERIYKDGGGNALKSVYDRWGTEIEYRQSNDQTGVGPANEKGDSIANNQFPLSRDPFFVSAGPDKVFGDNNGTNDDITTIEP